MTTEEEIIEELKELCNKALKLNEVPIAALIINNNKIIGRGYNCVEKTQNCMNHAEIIAIEEAMKNKKNWRLDDCILYTTLEPCSMCKEIIKRCRIKNIIYYSKQNNDHIQIKENINYLYKNNNYFSKLLTNFFKLIR